MSEAEKYAVDFLNKLDIDSLVIDFWDKNQHKIKDFYFKNKFDDDVILSAAPDFLINEICKRLSINNVISSNIDRNTGKIKQLCFRNNKVAIFKQHYPVTRIDEFYTDSMNDSPMFELAEKVYIVKGNKIKELKV